MSTKNIIVYEQDKSNIKDNYTDYGFKEQERNIRQRQIYNINNPYCNIDVMYPKQISFNQFKKEKGL